MADTGNVDLDKLIEEFKKQDGRYVALKKSIPEKMALLKERDAQTYSLLEEILEFMLIRTERAGGPLGFISM